MKGTPTASHWVAVSLQAPLPSSQCPCPLSLPLLVVATRSLCRPGPEPVWLGVLSIWSLDRPSCLPFRRSSGLGASLCRSQRIAFHFLSLTIVLSGWPSETQRAGHRPAWHICPATPPLSCLCFTPSRSRRLLRKRLSCQSGRNHRLPLHNVASQLLPRWLRLAGPLFPADRSRTLCRM